MESDLLSFDRELNKVKFIKITDNPSNPNQLFAVFELLYPLIRAFQPFLVPVCFFFAWAFVAVLGWGLWSAIADGVTRAKQMHQIPCAGCQFFNNDYRLKCMVHPHIANSEYAIDCPDYCPKTPVLY